MKEFITKHWKTILIVAIVAIAIWYFFLRKKPAAKAVVVTPPATPAPQGSESGFANDISSQNMVGFGIGQDWTVMNPFGNGGESAFSFGASQAGVSRPVSTGTNIIKMTCPEGCKLQTKKVTGGIMAMCDCGKLGDVNPTTTTM